MTGAAHGRSTQTSGGHDMDHYADDLAAVTEHLDLHDAIHVGHSTGGGEVVRYIGPARREPGGQGGADQLGAAADGADRRQSRRPAQERLRRPAGRSWPRNRSVFYRALPVGPVLRVQPARRRSRSEAIIENWWRQGMTGGAKAHYDGIVAFSQTDFTEDLKKISRAGAGHARR